MGGQVTTDAEIPTMEIISLDKCPRIPLPSGVITEDYIYANYIYDRCLHHRFDVDVWMNLGRNYRIHRETWHLPLEQKFNTEPVSYNLSSEPAAVNKDVVATIISTIDKITTQELSGHLKSILKQKSIT